MAEYLRNTMNRRDHYVANLALVYEAVWITPI